MATELEEMKWKLHKKRYDELFNYGVKHGLIGAYDKKLIENLRHIYYGGLPASILLLHGKLSNGHCYDRGTLVTLGFGDDDYIERGNLKFDERTPEYYHSWICFKFDDTEYVLDPCLSFLCKKSDYSKIFEIDVKGKVSAKAVKEELIRQITAPKEEDNSEAHKAFQSFMKSFMGDSYDSYVESKKEEVTVCGPEDVNTPLYRNGAGYRTEIDNGDRKSVV